MLEGNIYPILPLEKKKCSKLMAQAQNLRSQKKLQQRRLKKKKSRRKEIINAEAEINEVKAIIQQRVLTKTFSEQFNGTDKALLRLINKKRKQGCLAGSDGRAYDS